MSRTRRKSPQAGSYQVLELYKSGLASAVSMEFSVPPNHRILSPGSMAPQSSEQVNFLLWFRNYTDKNLFPKSIKEVKKTRNIIYAVPKGFCVSMQCSNPWYMFNSFALDLTLALYNFNKNPQIYNHSQIQSASTTDSWCHVNNPILPLALIDLHSTPMFATQSFPTFMTIPEYNMVCGRLSY